MTREKKIWHRMIRNLRPELGQELIETWFEPSRLERLDSKVALVRVPNKFVGNWLKEHYYDKIAQYFKDNLKVFPEIYFIPQDGQSQENNKAPSYLKSQRLNPAWTFQHFVTAESNLLACSAALQAVESPGGAYNPLYIYSPSSVGKSHLINAVGNRAAESTSGKVSYLSTDAFVTFFSLAKLNDQLEAFRASLSEGNYLLIDDLHLLEGRKHSQQELTVILNRLLETGSQIVFTSNGRPKDFKELIPGLKSRLSWGVICEIGEPEYETKVSIIKEKAKEEDLTLPDDVISFIAKSSNDIGHIVESIVKLGIYMSLHSKKIDISAARAVTERQNPESISVDHIQRVTADYFNISLRDLLSNKSSRQYSYPRNIAMYLSKAMTNTSITKIARAFGKKHHSSVIYAEKSIRAGKDNKKQILEDVNRLYKLLVTKLV